MTKGEKEQTARKRRKQTDLDIILEKVEQNVRKRLEQSISEARANCRMRGTGTNSSNRVNSQLYLLPCFVYSAMQEAKKNRIKSFEAQQQAARKRPENPGSRSKHSAWDQSIREARAGSSDWTRACERQGQAFRGERLDLMERRAHRPKGSTAFAKREDIV